MTKRFSPYASVLALPAVLWALHCGTPDSPGNGGSSSGGGSGGSSGSGASSSGASSGSGASSSGGSSGSGASSSGASGGSGSSGGSTSSSGSDSGASSGSSGGDSGVIVPPGADPCLPKQADNVAASVNPPAGLAPGQVPMFVMFGSDDNYYADSIDWLVKTALAGKTNPDGTPAQITFFITSGGGTTANGGVFTPGSVGQTEQQVVTAWQNAYAAGHQVGNHTWDHDKSDGTAGNSYTAAQWQTEIDTSQNFLISQAGIPACELDGWRFPYLAFDDDGFKTFAGAGFLFDTSVEFGYNWWQPPGSSVGYGPGSPESGKHFWWPFTLDTGFPSDPNSGFDPTETKGVGAHPGVWEFFAHVWNSPDPTTPGAVRTVTGLDYNMWQRIQTNPGQGYDFCGTLKYTFEQKYNGNRSPFNVGLHSTIYSPDDPAQDTFFGNTADVRRAGLQCFIDYLFSGQFPDVRVVGFHKVISWMRKPTAIH